MSDVDSLIPFLQQLVQRMRMVPPASDLELLQKATFKEMRPYFEAQTAGIPDAEIYKMILKYLANPANGTGLSGNAPASPPKPAAVAPAPKQATPTAAAPVASADGKRQIRKIMEGVELHVVEEDGPKWTFELSTKGTENLTVVNLDLSASMNIDVKAEGPCKSTGPLTLTVNVPTVANTGGKELRAVIATAKATSGNVSMSYKVAVRSGSQSAPSAPSTATSSTSAAQQQQQQATESDEPDDVTNVADGLTVIVQSVETGYKLYASNTHAANAYSVTIDLGESTNLTFVAVGAAKLDGPSKVSFTLNGSIGKVAVVDCNVKDYAVGSCDIRYKVSARIV
jgi:hypothetical protein